MNNPLEPWASVKNGKWHKVSTMPQSFREVAQSLCGLSFEPHNVAEGQPDYINEHGLCQTCRREAK